ncbi:MAG: hybrid sensor histidine kinase/response regulator, partial [Candidatus Acidiferrum sp.]
MQPGRVLICAPTERDGPLLVRNLVLDGVQSVWYDSIENLTQALDEDSLAIIIAEEALLPRGVESLFQFLKDQPAWSDIGVLLLLTHGDEKDPQVSSGLAYVFGTHGNVTMLERPIRVPTMISAV